VVGQFGKRNFEGNARENCEKLLRRISLGAGKKRTQSGYDVIAFIHNKFHLLMSSGSIYSTLYSLEWDGLIQGNWAKRKRVYALSDKGEKTIQAIMNASDNGVEEVDTEKTLSGIQNRLPPYRGL